MIRSLNAVLLVLLLGRLASSVTGSGSCANLDLSFSTSFDLTYGRDNFGGTATAVLDNGYLTVTYNAASGCKLIDTVHVNLVSIPTTLGSSTTPVPGRFPCKMSAYGSSKTIRCPIGSFDIDNCCADTFRLFAHAVLDCGGDEETAFGGSDSCTTRRWCFYEDVPVTVDCPICQACSSAARSCQPVDSDPLCSGEECKDTTTAVQLSCQSGMCKETLIENCDECDKCEESGSSASCVFDSTSPQRDVCTTCGEKCVPQMDGLGACEQQCDPEDTCTEGAGDNDDVCTPPKPPGCTMDDDCPSGENCINGECIPQGDCGQAKQAFCDAFFASLGGQGGRGKCCPDSSGCVKDSLKLGTNSVCSTECGGTCDPDAISGGTSINEVYCVFGDPPVTLSLPACTS